MQADENVASSPTEETAETVVEPNGETPAEAVDNTETETAQAAGTGETKEEVRGPIPYDRFAEVISERNTERQENERLRERLQTLERGGDPAPATTVEEDLGDPPEGMSQREKVRWYIRKDAKDMIREELGMDLGEAKALLQTVPTVGRQAAQRQWEEACGKHGLDPADKMVQNFARGLVKNAGHSLDDALSAIKAFGGSPAEAATSEETPTPQRMHHDTNTGANVGKNSPLVFSKKQASKMAQQGQRAPDASVMDILDAVEKNRRGVAR